MKRLAAFGFFLLFLGGLALVNLRGMSEQRAAAGAPPSQVELASRLWSVAELGDHPPASLQPMRIQFDTAGGIAVVGACNQYGGDYDYAQGQLRVGELAGTRKACSDEAMRADLSLIRVLGAEPVLRVRAGKLLLRAADGTALAGLRPADDSS